MAGHARDSIALKEIGIILQRDGNSVFFVPQVKREIKLGSSRFKGQWLESHSRNAINAYGGVLENDIGLIQRIAAHVARRLQGRNQPLKREILVIEGVKYHGPNAAQQFQKRRVAGQVRAQ